MITDIRKRRIYTQINDTKIKQILGRAFKQFKEHEVATMIQQIVHLWPMTRRFDAHTFHILNCNKDNEHFLRLLREKIKDNTK